MLSKESHGLIKSWMPRYIVLKDGWLWWYEKQAERLFFSGALDGERQGVGMSQQLGH